MNNKKNKNSDIVLPYSKEVAIIDSAISTFYNLKGDINNLLDYEKIESANELINKQIIPIITKNGVDLAKELAKYELDNMVPLYKN